ncbi:glycosyltransferase family 4 protein [Halarcobacter sp.]|uniref:glycosyltransferase family 4 protein n=1 Tax=Halarcobacter sp. TaxID=2321133 RepID=UPI003B00B010
MNIWIFNHHALTPDMSGGTRHYDFALELQKRGHSVTIIASSFHYSKYKEMKEYGSKDYLIEKIKNINFIWLKTFPYYGNGIKRVINMLSYTYKSRKVISNLDLEKPDIIIGSSVHLFAVYAAYKSSKEYNVPFIMEVRDLWPQTLIDMGMSKWHPFILSLSFLERFLYKKADKIISNLPYANQYIDKYTENNKFVWVSNGVDFSNIDYKKREEDNKFIITYTGSIGFINNLHILLEVAKNLRDYRDIYFKIVGDGVDKDRLVSFSKENNLSNVFFEPQVPKSEVYSILQNSDLLFIIIKNSPLYRFGISSNKLFDYMASGRVVLFSGESINNPIREADAGYIVKSDNIELLKNKILEIYSLSKEEREKIGLKARTYIQKNYATEVLVDKLELVLKKEIEKKNA